ncbi:hypothetical protein CR103_19405 [Massilia psychrophila]|uniref:Uncharacterized protein n=1 Tax=Massilia psychrophila TaxID=1603353 RepID=A0A2G8SWU0_9BURK|nr:hypothetical protein CR103_19405 [Massilia psychrophila]
MTFGARRLGPAAGAGLVADGRGGAGSAFGGGGTSRTAIDVRAACAGCGAILSWRQANSSAACSASDKASPAIRRDGRGLAMTGSSEEVGFTYSEKMLVTHVRIP